MDRTLRNAIVGFLLGFGGSGVIINLVLYNQEKSHWILGIDTIAVIVGMLIAFLVPVKKRSW